MEKASRLRREAFCRNRELRCSAAAAGDRSENGEQDHGAYEGDHEQHDEVGHGDVEKDSREPTPYERADDADHYVPDETHAMAGHHLARQEAGDPAHDDVKK